MPNSGSKSSSLLNWIGGVAATVIAGVLIFYATRQPPPPPPVVLPQIGLNGIVADVLSQKPIPDALVTVDLGRKLATQNTDMQGRYSFIMDGVDAHTQVDTASVDILVSGYVHYSTILNVRPGQNFAEIRVKPVAAIIAPTQPAQAMPAPAAPPPQAKAPPERSGSVLILRAPTNYQIRLDAAPLKFKPKP